MRRVLEAVAAAMVIACALWAAVTVIKVHAADDALEKQARIEAEHEARRAEDSTAVWKGRTVKAEHRADSMETVASRSRVATVPRDTRWQQLRDSLLAAVSIAEIQQPSVRGDSLAVARLVAVADSTIASYRVALSDAWQLHAADSRVIADLHAVVASQAAEINAQKRVIAHMPKPRRAWKLWGERAASLTILLLVASHD